jgi:predicted house-cleaning noncanonical NTP pyrophosphatase (MazG superfamily)
MVQRYNKLVRDHIPAIIEAEGRQCATEIMNETDYIQALLQKLLEEAQEVAEATVDKRVIELADLYEVVDAILTSHSLQEADIREIQAQRRKERGGFVQRIKLLWTE